MAETIPDRQVFAITGSDRVSFLQGLITNDVAHLSEGLVYAALLTPQGKYLADFFLAQDGDQILLDVKSTLAQGLLQRLTMYRLRSDVQIVPVEMAVSRGLGDVPKGAFADPRDPSLGWRAYGAADLAGTSGTDWDALHVAACIPETGVELTPDTFILEAGFERLNGVDFRKGCYVGQEVTARMKHKTSLRKGLARVTIDGTAPVGTAITRDGKDIGTLFTQANGQGIAFLRLDRAGADMMAGDVHVALIDDTTKTPT